MVTMFVAPRCSSSVTNSCRSNTPVCPPVMCTEHTSGLYDKIGRANERNSECVRLRII